MVAWLAALLVAACAATGGESSHDASVRFEPRLFGVELCVDDVAAATSMWRDQFGFVVEQDVSTEAGVVLMHDDLRLWLRPSRSAAKNGATPTIEPRFDSSQVRALEVCLPVTDRAAASALLARIGFSQDRFNVVQRPAADPFGPRRGAILLAVPDLAAARAALRERGADFASEVPTSTTLGPSLSVRGPDGALLRVIERSPAVLTFERLRALAGRWKTRSSIGWEEDCRISVIAAGSAILEQSEGAHPGETMLTVWHLDGSRLLLTHYCVARSQPRLVATRFEDDGATVYFEFLDATNLASRDVGHMDSIVYHFDGPDRFTSQWSWYQDGREKPFEEITAERLR